MKLNIKRVLHGVRQVQEGLDINNLFEAGYTPAQIREIKRIVKIEDTFQNNDKKEETK